MTAEVSLVTHSPEETQALGRALGAHACPGDLILLVGPLGAGKTCLTQGVLWGLGAGEHARSPTFVLVAEYPGRIPLYHIDLFRLGRRAEIEDLGLEEYLDGDGLCIVEWADRAAGLFPEDHLLVTLEPLSETERRLTLRAGGPSSRRLLEACRRAATGHWAWNFP